MWASWYFTSILLVLSVFLCEEIMSWRVFSVCRYALYTSVLIEWGFICCWLKSLALCASTLWVQNESNRAFRHVKTHAVWTCISSMFLIWLGLAVLILCVDSYLHCADHVMIRLEVMLLSLHSMLLFWSCDLSLIILWHLEINIFYCAVFIFTPHSFFDEVLVLVLLYLQSSNYSYSLVYTGA